MNRSVVMLLSGAAVAAGLITAVVIRKPMTFVAGIALSVLVFFVLNRKEEEKETGEPRRRKPPPPSPPVLEDALGAGATSNSSPGGGPAKMHDFKEGAAANPSLFPIPFRIKERKFWEDPMDDRVRWPVSGPNAPYTAWRGVNGIW